MKDKKLRGVVTKQIAAYRLCKIYQKLEDEDIPYEASIKIIAKGVKQVTIHCDEKDIAYFTNLLSDEN